MEHPTEQTSESLLEPGHLEQHQASPQLQLTSADGATKMFSLVGLVMKVPSRHVNPVCVVKNRLQQGPITLFT